MLSEVLEVPDSRDWLAPGVTLDRLDSSDGLVNRDNLASKDNPESVDHQVNH